MSDSGATTVGFLILVPIILVFVIAFTAIKCSEYVGAKWEKVQDWKKARKSKKQRRNQSDPSSEGSSDSAVTQESNDIEAGKW